MPLAAATRALGLAALAYLVAGIPFGLLIARVHGIDIRRFGSGNIGATNVARALGPYWAGVVLLLDTLKGMAPLLLARWALPDARASAFSVALVMVAAVAGHVFSPYLRFRGGKGVATALGVLLAVDPLSAAAGCLAYVVALAAWRVSALGSLAGVACALITMVFLTRPPLPISAAMAAIAVVVAARHRDNLRRLRGKE